MNFDMLEKLLLNIQQNKPTIALKKIYYNLKLDYMLSYITIDEKKMSV